MLFLVAVGLKSHYEHTVSNTNEPTLLQIGNSGPWGKDVKRSTLKIRKSKLKVTHIAKARPGGPVDVTFSP